MTDVTRIDFEFDRERVVIDVSVSVRGQPQWDELSNNHFALMRKNAARFLKCAGIIIARVRCQTRLKKIQKFIRSKKIRTKAEMAKFVELDQI